MRNWMREQLKRRKKSTENTSESTGKVGQAIDHSQPAPLVPSYEFNDAPPAAVRERPQDAEAGDREPSHAYRSHAEPARPREERPARTDRPARNDRPSRPNRPARENRPGGEARGDRQGRGRNRNRGNRKPREQEPLTPQMGEGKVEVETQPESPNAPPAGADAATRKPEAKLKEPRGVVVLTIGLPGSGKTTWYKRRGVTPLSSDMLRSILFDSITEQRYQGLVFSTLRSLLRARLIAKMPWNYVDATNLSPHERRQWIKMARGFGYEVHAVFFDVPLEVCMERNRKRERQVVEDVMKQMAARLKPPTFKEGFSKIVVVRVKSAGEEPEAAS